MIGLVISAQWRGRAYDAERATPPIFWAAGEPVHEVWFWDRELRLWFVMCADPSAITDLAQRRVGFYLDNTKQQLIALRAQYRAYLCRSTS